jgi:RHS repeat-associated protein
VDSAWFAQAQRTSLTYPNARKITFTHDALERIRNIQDSGAPTNIAQYTYIGPDRVLQRQFQNGTQLTFLDNAGTTDVGYDPLRRTIQRRDLRSDNSLVVGFGHAYDRENNKSYEAKFQSPTNSEVYNYDSAYRIIDFQRGQLNGTNTGIIPPPSATEDWTLDGVGNWRIDTVNGVPGNNTVNSVNEYTNVNGGPLTYDLNGNLVSASLGYQWDYRNRLRQVCSLPAGATSCTAPGTQLLAVYSYDAMNRRTRKVVTNSGSLNGTTNFYYDAWRSIEERDGLGVLTQQYVFGAGVDEPLVLDRGGQRLFYHQNTLSSSFALTDSTAAVVEGYQYSAYGQQTVFAGGFTTPIGTASAVGNPFLYTGQRFDPESGLYYYKNRYYLSTIGRFLQRDPLEYGTSMNLYEYVGSAPTAFTDPSGMQAPMRDPPPVTAREISDLVSAMRSDQMRSQDSGLILDYLRDVTTWLRAANGGTADERRRVKDDLNALRAWERQRIQELKNRGMQGPNPAAQATATIDEMRRRLAECQRIRAQSSEAYRRVMTDVDRSAIVPPGIEDKGISPPPRRR